MRSLFPLILVTTTALGGVASADALRDTVAGQFKPLPSTIPAVKDNPVTPEKIDLGKALEGIARQPEATSVLRTNMFLGIAFTEALALIGLVAGFLFV